MGKSRKKKRGATSHAAIRVTLVTLVERAQAAAYRVVCARHDEEAVHSFRVALRRIRTILRASRKTYGKARVKPIEEALAQFGRITNPLRDAEVLAETLELCAFDETERGAVERWLSQRREREARLRDAVVEELLGPSLEEAFSALTALLSEGPRRDEALRRYARRRLSDVRDEVAELLPVDDDDIEALHRLRLRFKRLRYVGEMLQGFLEAFPDDERKGLRKRLSRTVRSAAAMQKLLGQLHDADAALIALPEEPLDEADRAVLARGLRASRDRLAARSLRRLRKMHPSVVGTDDLVHHTLREEVVAVIGASEPPPRP